MTGQTSHWVTPHPGSQGATLVSSSLQRLSGRNPQQIFNLKRKKKTSWKIQREKCRHVAIKCEYYWGKYCCIGGTGWPCRYGIGTGVKFQNIKCEVIHSGTNNKTFQYYWGAHQLQWWWSISVLVMGWIRIAILMQLLKKLTQLCTSISLQRKFLLYCCVQFWLLIFEGFKPVQKSKIFGKLWIC